MLTTVNIDFSKLKSTELNESFVAQWAADVKYVLKHVMSQPLLRNLEETEEEKTKVVIKGSKDDVEAFVDTIKKEKEYALEYLENGLGAETLPDIKLELEKSIHNFEKTTGLKWPLG